ncbi:hypothetical protein QIH85_24385 [Bradyrhizobium japonicum]|uniref:hypothetical protein n=1 Tax=Bradyrhizobium japonicum TaxID=375 RepID=UPI0027151C74|nr:hypothetical protein [Bradyrhizobium japonicum]WLB25020.1 hypothetical protein QIH85_24385 [Bradyrhizobium japonicum]
MSELAQEITKLGVGSVICLVLLWVIYKSEKTGSGERSTDPDAREQVDREL